MGRMSRSVLRTFCRCSSAGWLCELLQCKFLFSRSFLSFFVSLMTVKSFFSAVWQFCTYLFWPRGGKSKKD